MYISFIYIFYLICNRVENGCKHKLLEFALCRAGPPAPTPSSALLIY